MSLPDTLNLGGQRGATIENLFNLQEDNAPWNLSNYTISIVIKENRNESPVAQTIQISDSGESDFANGIVHFRISPTISDNLPPASYYELQAADASDTYLLARGRLVIID